MFLSDINKHQYIEAQSHLLHILSLHLPLPPHTHTHIYKHTHTTHTLAQGKLGRHELIRFLEVEEIVFFLRADLKVSIVVAFLMCSGSEFQTEGPK